MTRGQRVLFAAAVAFLTSVLLLAVSSRPVGDQRYTPMTVGEATEYVP